MAANLATLQAVYANIPRINGNFEVGIAVGQDPSLPDNQKMTLLSSNAQHDHQRVIAINCALTIFHERPTWVRDIDASAALAIVDCSLIGYSMETRHKETKVLYIYFTKSEPILVGSTVQLCKHPECGALIC